MLKPIHIGSLLIGQPVLLAPMSGVTDLPFRTQVRKFGCGLVYSEMIASGQMVRAHTETLRMSSNCADEGEMAVQLAGCDPVVMAEAAKMNEARGAALIDINMGCPAKKVVGGMAGSALMRDEDNALRIIEAVVQAVKIPVTLKMRMGWDHDNLNAPSIARKAEAAGIQLITVHGRTRQQLYTGNADWAFIANVKQALRIPVIANGDVVSVDDAATILRVSGADGVMIGRGAFGRPWFPAQIQEFLATGRRVADPTATDKSEIVSAHYDALLSHYGVYKGMRIARKHLAWYAAGQRNANAFRVQVNTQENSDRVKELIVTVFRDQAELREAA
ncbi:MAG: tRNA dihydrouridine synthase DusB [Alphaproteobacteria bacterium]|nr:tRNA dihydrouridine synthase DusB [Alphaproteobacteria bacterium]PHX98503.1 MAG: tRNA dihydrouridine synthase DusB [Rhodospirillaceae bacterium]